LYCKVRQPRAVGNADASTIILSRMARIVVCCWGSHGDFDPSLGLALGLRARGHEVAIATLRYFEPYVRDAGLGFHPIRPDADPSDRALVTRIMDRDRGTEFLLRELIYPALPAMYEDLSAAVAGADLVVSHPLTLPIPMLGELRGIRWASTVLAPISFFSPTDLPVLPPAPWLKSLEALGAWVPRGVSWVARTVSHRWAEPVRDFRRSLGLGPGGDPMFDGQHSPYLVLALYSRLLGGPQPDWPTSTVVTGHMFHDGAHGTALDPEVERFLADGAPPVLFTLGSSAVLSPGRFWDESLAAVQRTGMRALCLVGPGNVEAVQARAPRDVLVVERAPHSLVMPRASVIVQQCGIGTLAQGLRSGVPLLAVPFAHDQPDNAYRASRLGVARILPPARYRARRVAEELRILTSDPSFRQAAARVSAAVREEGGVSAACDALEARFGLH
jgi:rhamnosyltransferase subunit B